MGLYMFPAISQGIAIRDIGRKLIAGSVLGMGILMTNQANALTFQLPEQGNVVGSVQTTVVRSGDTLSKIGREHDIGGYEMKEANPGVSYLYPRIGSKIIIPSRFVLPSGERKGIVVNLAEMRIYYYHPDKRTVSTYPIGIGKQGWLTPLGKTTIVKKTENPWWIVPDSILEKHANTGNPIPPRMPPGPKNPLGPFKMNLGFKNIVIHGTPYPAGVGIRSSHGCMRMLNSNIRELFQMVEVGTPVRVVHEPHKVGVLGDEIFLESHIPLSEPIYHNSVSVEQLLDKAKQSYGIVKNYQVSWDDARKLQKRASGYPLKIGIFN